MIANKGWPINFRTANVLIGFEGGKVRTKLNDKDVVDDADTELLILQPDGKMLVRNSGLDAKDRQRTDRKTTWDDWLKRVQARKDTAVDPAAGSGGRPPGFGGRGPGAGS